MQHTEGFVLKRASSSLPRDTNERVCIVVNEAQGVYSLRHSLYTGYPARMRKG